VTTLSAQYAFVPDQNQIELAEEVIDLDDLPSNACVVEAEMTVISPGTELAVYSAMAPGVRTPGSWNAYPWRPGYGLVGRVIETGASVERVHQGDRVFCFGKHASHQIYSLVSAKPISAIYLVPEDVPATALAMLRMALVAIHAPQLTQCRPGDTVAVFGLGVVGNLAAQLYRHAGLQVIGLDPVAMRCERARQAGVEQVVQVAPELQLDALRDLTGGRGAEVCVDAAGHSAVVESAVAACADFGQIILLGSPRVPLSGNLTRTFRDIHMRGLTMRGALEWRLPPYSGIGIAQSLESNLAYLIQMVRAGRLNLEAITTHVVTPQDMPRVYDGLLHHKESYLGVLVDWARTESHKESAV
jgi:2-desacetyl-2-hydroxyethyl bacteriochlorophyllide A dehydrogenase